MPGQWLRSWKAALSVWARQERGCELDWETQGGRCHYLASETAWGSVTLLYDPDQAYAEAVHKGRFAVQFAGGFFDRLTRENLVSLAAVLGRFDFRATRVDTYIDDVEKVVKLQTVWEACKAGQVRGFRAKRKATGKGGIRRIEELGPCAGEGTLYFGGRGDYGNGKHVRWYDKTAESGGGEQGNRLEVEWTRKLANEVWLGLVAFGFNGYDIAGRTFSVLEFIDDPECHRRECWVRLPWWDLLHRGINNVYIETSAAVTNVAKKMAWVRASVAKSLAYIQRFMVKLALQESRPQGFDGWLREVIEQAAADLGRVDLVRIGKDLADCRGQGVAEGLAM
jgi:hypothetical protein